MFVFEVDDEGVRQAFIQLDKAISPRSLITFMRTKVTPYFRSQFDASFTLEGRTREWSSLSELWTVSEREEKGFGGAHPIQQRTGDLRSLVTGFHGETWVAAGEVYYQIPDNSELFEKYIGLQMGINPNPLPGHDPIPARPMVEMVSSDVEMLLSMLSRHINFVGGLLQ